MVESFLKNGDVSKTLIFLLKFLSIRQINLRLSLKHYCFFKTLNIILYLNYVYVYCLYIIFFLKVNEYSFVSRGIFFFKDES